MSAAEPAGVERELRQAETLCQRRGVRLTTQRRRVLRAVCGAGRPVGAYDILAALRTELPRVAPPTVYRALEFLQRQGLVHKLQTLHAYVGCAHPDHPHASQFLICTDCGEVEEIADAAIADSLGQAAAASGFQPTHGVVELTGTCADCAAHRNGR